MKFKLRSWQPIFDSNTACLNCRATNRQYTIFNQITLMIKITIKMTLFIINIENHLFCYRFFLIVILIECQQISNADLVIVLCWQCEHN